MLLFLTCFISITHFTLAQVSDGCELTEQCVPIRSCQPVVSKLKIAKNTSDSDEKAAIIADVRSKICGELSQKLICCSGDYSDLAPAAPQQEELLGEFVNLFHDIGGKVYKKSDSQIVIKGFTYDGEGPDAFFLAGLSGVRPNSRSTNGDIVLAYPFEGKHFKYLDRDIPILKAFDGTKDVVLTLPPGISADQIRWISVWCRDYKVNFGHASL